jgi:hypothetical protein
MAPAYTHTHTHTHTYFPLNTNTHAKRRENRIRERHKKVIKDLQIKEPDNKTYGRALIGTASDERLWSERRRIISWFALSFSFMPARMEPSLLSVLPCPSLATRKNTSSKVVTETPTLLQPNFWPSVSSTLPNASHIHVRTIECHLWWRSGVIKRRETAEAWCRVSIKCYKVWKRKVTKVMKVYEVCTTINYVFRIDLKNNDKP